MPPSPTAQRTSARAHVYAHVCTHAYIHSHAHVYMHTRQRVHRIRNVHVRAPIYRYRLRCEEPASLHPASTLYTARICVTRLYIARRRAESTWAPSLSRSVAPLEQWEHRTKETRDKLCNTAPIYSAPINTLRPYMLRLSKYRLKSEKSTSKAALGCMACLYIARRRVESTWAPSLSRSVNYIRP